MSSGLNAVRKPAISVHMGRAFQAWGIGRAKTLGWEPAWPVWEIAKMSMWLEMMRGRVVAGKDEKVGRGQII